VLHDCDVLGLCRVRWGRGTLADGYRENGETNVKSLHDHSILPALRFEAQHALSRLTPD
jgi:hypothetical protein